MTGGVGGPAIVRAEIQTSNVASTEINLWGRAKELHSKILFELNYCDCYNFFPEFR